jgi:polyisoprenoid-binding protein YceI
MSVTDETTTAASTSALAEGNWRVDPSRSELSFQARGTFGLVNVRGSFREYEGQMTVSDNSVHGELSIEAASLDTGNKKRDKHLRSSDFFDADAHKTLTFTLLGVAPGAAGLTLRGVLRIKGAELEVTAPLEVERSTDGITLSTALDVDRAAAGVGWSKAGMIKGPATLAAKLTLVSA